MLQPCVLSFNAPPPTSALCPSHFSLKTLQGPNKLFVNKNSLISPQTHSRRLICKPPAGKYLSDDYLVIIIGGRTVRPCKTTVIVEVIGEKPSDASQLLKKKLSAKEVQELVKGDRNLPVVLDFYATWCGPCVLMAQELEMLAVEYENNAIIVKVDTDDEYEFARDMQVRGLPTVYFISPDPKKDAIRTEGLVPIQMMRDILENDM